jgi:Tfp pilus assembly protein PilF
MPSLALSMIVKNGERDLPDCLASVRGVADEIVVADTGSSDSSAEIARQAGARVISIPWENDFAKARNLSLAEVTTDWVLMLDADERLDPAAASVFPSHLANKEVAGYQVTIRNYLRTLTQTLWDRPAIPNDSSYEPARAYPAFTAHENVRLFRRDPEIYFVGRVHETTGPRIQETGRKLGRATFLIHHFGMVVDDVSLAKKLLFYRQLGQQKVAEMPEDGQAHLELGIVELENLGNVNEALPYFQRACKLKPQYGVAWFFAAKCQFRLGQFTEAVHSLRKAEAAGHKTVAVAELAGDANYNLGDYQAACDCYRRASKRSSGSSAIESRLGLAEARAGKVQSGLRRIRRAIEAEPRNPDFHDRLVIVEVWLNHLSEAACAAEKKLTTVTPRAEDFLRAASIRAQMQEWQKAGEILRQGLEIFPASEPLRANLSKLEVCKASPSVALGEKVNR